jgi:DNA polymerase V
MFTMGDVAECSIYNEERLYRLFGVNAELLIDHAWGWEPCTIADIKAYKPNAHSISQGQVLSVPYNYEKAHLIIREMTELLVLDLVAKEVVTNQMVLTVGYDIESAKNYSGELVTDHYGRKIPKSAHSSINLKNYTSSGKIISEAVSELYHRIVDENLLVRRMSIAANHIIPENQVQTETFYQLDFFTDYNTQQKQREAENRQLIRERNIQNAVLGIKSRYGKNAILKGFNLQEGATSIERNSQIGGHRA